MNHINIGTVNNGNVDETNRGFSWYVPTNLTGTPAVVFIAAGASCGSSEIGTQAWSSSNWQSVLNANAVMAVVLEKPLPCNATVEPARGSGGSSWLHKQIDCGGSPSVCGTPAVPSDAPYLVAVKNYLCTHTFGGITPDCTRLYLNGGSSGGALSRMAICDPTTVGLFRAVSILSNGANATTTGTTGICPAGGDKSIFVQNISSTNDTQTPYNTLTLSDHRILGFAATNSWFAGTYFGCTSVSNTTSGIVTTSNYTCPTLTLSSQYQSISVVTTSPAGHGWSEIDSYKGTGWTAGAIWAFFAGTTE